MSILSKVVALLIAFCLTSTAAFQSPQPGRHAALISQRTLANASEKRPVALITFYASGWMEYMYEPAISTLRVAFETDAQSIDVLLPTSVSGNMRDTQIRLFEEFEEQTANLGRGDIVIFVGWKVRLVGSLAQVPKLREKGIYTVFYNADPSSFCQLDATQVDEIWDFSHKNIRNCANQSVAYPDRPGPPQRFVPLGALETPTVTYDSESADAQASGQRMNSLGHIWSERKECFAKLESMIAEKNLKLEMTKDVWADDAYKALLNTTDIFLNMNHRCDKEGNLAEDERDEVFWRVPKLINAHGLVISEPCWPRDQEEFAGVVDFVPFGQIAQKYAELAALPAAARQRLGDERAKLFAEKFAPKTIFERASIFDLMSCLQDPECDPKSTVPAQV
eukprot:TRINITY_DN2772_c0_g3_i1.p1 TRINITY_DN2772_c0_g3~~TRINITY_DN2772_c0_g3_i1.p1  ORF type:complete len:393 (-),score=67.40 TRINITY_DN2772_c0_g3_i1:114-1292(-)